jgi:cell division protein YceG involved in septum cleavage
MVEEKQAQYADKSLKHSKSEYFDFLKKEIAFKNKIIDTLLQATMIKEEDIEAKVRQALRKNEDKPLISIVSKVEKEVLKTAKTKEEEQLIADIFVRILTRLSEED